MSDRVFGQDGAPIAQEPRHRPLAEDAIGLSDGVILGLASAAVGVDLVAALAPMTAAAGYGAVLALLIGFIPLLGIGLSFYYLNRWRPDVGISYAWVGRALNPYVGAFVGLLVILAFVISNAFVIIPAASTFLTLFSDTLPSDNTAITVTGTAMLVAITVLVVTGIRIAARFQWVFVTVELAVLGLFGVWAFIHAMRYGGPGTATPSLSWFSIDGAGGMSGLLDGVLISVFWYSGWETAVVVNEETRSRFRSPGLAGIGALTGLLVVSLMLCTFFLSAVSPTRMNDHPESWLADLGVTLAGPTWGKIMALALASSFIGAIETTIITFGRVAFSMGRDGVLPRAFAKVNDRTKTPWLAMIVLSVPSLAIFLVSLWSASGTLGTVFSNLSASLGLIFSIYYILTAVAAITILRRVALRSPGAFVSGLVLPGIAIAILAWAGYESLMGLSHSGLVTVFGTLALAVVTVLASRFLIGSSFYTRTDETETEVVGGGS